MPKSICFEFNNPPLAYACVYAQHCIQNNKGRDIVIAFICHATHNPFRIHYAARFKCARAVINIIREGVIIKGDQSIAYREHNFKTEVQFLNLV